MIRPRKSAEAGDRGGAGERGTQREYNGDDSFYQPGASHSPGLLPNPLLDPVVYRLVPELGVLRLQHPVAFVREIKHPRGHAHHLQGVEKLEPLTDVQAIIELTVNDEGGRLEILGRVTRRPLFVNLRVGIRRTFELPVVEPKLFGCAPRRDRIKHAVVRNDAFKALGVPQYPIGHVSAITRSERTLPILVDIGVILLDVVEALHQIFERSATPVAIDGVDEVLSVAGRSVEVDHNNRISISRK